jgi:integrase
MAKRSAGEGTIYQREDGLWSAQITLPNGKRKTKYGKTQKAVREWLQEQVRAIKDQNWIEADTVTVSAFIDRYMSDVAAHTLRPKTIESYNSLIRMHIKPELGTVKLSRLRPDQLQKLYSTKLDSGLSTRTVQFIHSILHKTLDQALKWGLVARNVADLVDAPTVKKKAQVIYTSEQVKVFLDHAKGSRFFPMYCLACLGLREGEILGVAIEDFDRKAHTLQIRQAVQYLIGKGLVLSEPKTEKGKRSVKLPDFIYDALIEHCDHLERNQGLMFTTSNGTPFSPRNFFRDFKEQTESAGLPSTTFHSMRHFAISEMMSQGIAPSIVQAIVGHASPLLTLGVYTHISTSMQNEAAEKMNAVLSQ